MKGEISGINFVTRPVMKYWAFPASYSQEKKKAEVEAAIFSKGYIGSLKRDGYFEALIKDDWGNYFMISREGKDKWGWCPQFESFMDKLPNGTVITGEVYFPNNEGSKKVTSVLGCLKEKAIARQSQGEKLHFYGFDIYAYNGKSLLNTPAAERFALITKLANTEFYDEEYVSFAKFYKGKALWNKLQQYLSEGREGIVIMSPDAKVYSGRTPAHVSLKVKKELEETLDVIVIGANAPTEMYGGQYLETWKYWKNTLTGERVEGDYFYEHTKGGNYIPITKMYFMGAAGSLKIGLMKDGKVVQIGSLSGLAEEVLYNWRDYIGKVCEITGMELFYDDEGNFSGIRHPKFKCFREDKTPRDCEWEQLK